MAMTLDHRPCVWVNRPEPQASAHAKLLETRGFNTFKSPVLEIEALTLPIEVPSTSGNFQAVLVSSVNALENIPKSWISKLREIPLITSGVSTQKRALEIGFANVIASKGKGSLGMVDPIRSTLETGNHEFRPELLYLAGTPRTPILENALSDEFTILVVEIYEAKLSNGLSNQTLNAIMERQVIATTLFSARSAAHAAKLLQNSPEKSVRDSLRLMLAVCISPSVENIARQNGFLKTSVSDNESSESVVDKLVEQLKNSHI